MCVMKRTVVCLLFVLGFVGSASAAQIVWDDEGGDGDWHNPLNWAGDALPGSADQWQVKDGGSTVTINADVDSFRANAGWNNGDGHIIINSGNVNVSGGIGMGQGGNGTTGSLTMNGGSLTMGSWGFFVGYQKGIGILNMNDGLIDASAIAMNVGFGTWAAASETKGYVYLHGGTIKAGSLRLDERGNQLGTQEAKVEFDGGGKLILTGDVVAGIDAEIALGNIYGLGGQTVVATFADGFTTVQVPEPATLALLSCGLGMVARRRARR